MAYTGVQAAMRPGFTLLELSVVLIIVGLLAGGVMIGRDMIEAARLRSQIAQLQGITTAVYAFRIKYGSLPGDLPASKANEFGFTPRPGTTSLGDDNGIIGTGSHNFTLFGGEALLFWSDLSSAGLIEGKFSTAAATDGYPTGSFDKYFPRAKIRDETYVIVFSDRWSLECLPYCYGVGRTQPPGGGFSPVDAYNIDVKIDDGLPLRGNVVAGSAIWEVVPEPDRMYVPFVDWFLETDAGTSCVAITPSTSLYRTTGDRARNPICAMNFEGMIW